jgi:8-amino-7-oxononanoate synthase
LTNSLQPFIRTALEQRRQGHQLRNLLPVSPKTGALVEIDGQPLVNFSSNDYLGLAHHPALIEGSSRYLNRYGAGAGASRLVCGSYPYFAELETRLAALKGTEAALIMNSGFQANASLIPALVNRDSLVLTDRLCHNSIIQGVLLSRARHHRFRHNNLGHLRELLERHGQTCDRILIITETVFSMDGDRCDLDALMEIARCHGAMLMVDEAHATGVLGAKGMGLACGQDIDLIMGTFGKGLGSYGAYVACSAEMREYLINFCAGFIYSTALPPAVLGAIDAALTLVPTLDRERIHLQDLARSLRQGLHQLGLSTGDSTTQIVPVILGGERETLAMSQWLRKKGMLAAAIRPPTVEQGRARLRVALSSLHTIEQVDQLLDAIKSGPGT